MKKSDWKNIKKALILSLILLFTFSAPAMAAITKIIAIDQAGDYYEYSCTDLNEAYMNSLLELPGAELYDHFRTMKSIKAFYDDVRGYVDYNDVYNAYLNSLLGGIPFSADTYTSTVAVQAQMPETFQVVTLVNGQVTLESVSVLPAFTMQVEAGLAPGKSTVIVTLNTATPEKYEVSVAGTVLTYHSENRVFCGEVETIKAIDSNVTVTVKSPLPRFTMEVKTGLMPGKSVVIVTLNAATPENYNVTVAGISLTYNPTVKKFTGEVDTVNAVEAKVVITEKAVAP